MEVKRETLDNETIVCALLGEMIRKVNETQSIEPALECAARIHKMYTEKSAVEEVDKWISSEDLAEWMHNNYEEIAKEKGWNTQENTKVAFDDLPDANKWTMIELADRIGKKFNLIKPLPSAPKQDKQK